MSKGKVSALNLNDQKTITNARVRFLERAFVCGCWRRLQLDICTKRTPFLVACGESQRSRMCSIRNLSKRMCSIRNLSKRMCSIRNLSKLFAKRGKVNLSNLFKSFSFFLF